MLVTNAQASCRWSAEVDRVIGFDTIALMCPPLCNGDRIYGAIEVANYLSSGEFDENDLAILPATSRFGSRALQEAEDTTHMEGKIS